jgi:hypothetical protein
MKDSIGRSKQTLSTCSLYLQALSSKGKTVEDSKLINIYVPQIPTRAWSTFGNLITISNEGKIEELRISCAFLSKFHITYV